MSVRGANNNMICSKCGNEFPNVIKECPFCTTQQTRENYIDIRESYSYEQLTPKSSKQGMHWFFALLIGLTTMLSLAICIFYFLSNVIAAKIVQWIDVFLLGAGIFGVPTFACYYVWLRLTHKRYKNHFMWKCFSLLQTLLVTASICFTVFIAEQEFPLGINTKILYLLTFIITFSGAIIPYKYLSTYNTDNTFTKDDPSNSLEKTTRESLIQSSSNVPIASASSPRSFSKTPIILSLCTLLLGIAIGFFSGVSFSPIDRNSTIKYPITKNSYAVDTVYVNLKSGNVFHKKASCRLEEQLLKVSNDLFIEISEYEAILRRFERCPSCYQYATSSDVYSLEYEIDDLIDTMK